MLTNVEEHLEKSETVNIKRYIYISDDSLYCQNVFLNVGMLEPLFRKQLTPLKPWPSALHPFSEAS